MTLKHPLLTVKFTLQSSVDCGSKVWPDRLLVITVQIGTTLNLAGMVGGVTFALFIDKLGIPLKTLTIVLYAAEALIILFFLVA